MKTNLKATLLMAAGLLLSACGEDGAFNTAYAADYTGTDSANTNFTRAGAVIPDGSRLLAAQCFQCHGTNGQSTTGIDSLAGESENELLQEMREMKAETDNDLMHYQARGYTDVQIQMIAAYIASLGGGSNGSSGDDD